MSVFKVIKNCYYFLYEQKTKFWVVNILKVVFLIISLIPTYMGAIIISKLETSEFELLVCNVVVLFISYLLCLIFDALIFFIRQKIEKESRAKLKKVFMRKLFEGQIFSVNTAKITEILYSDVNNVVNLLFGIFDIIVNIFFACILSVILIFIHFYFALFIILITSLISIYAYVMTKKVKRNEIDIRKETDQHFKLSRDMVKNIRQIKMTNSIDSHLNSYERNIDEVKVASIKKEKQAWLVGYVITATNYLIVIALLLFGGKAISLNLLSAYSLIIFLSYSSKFTSLCTSFIKGVVGLQYTIVSVERVLPILLYHFIPKQDAFPLGLNLIQIKNLEFGYENKKIFDKFNLTINKGESVLITGENGSGKTTLLNLLAAFSLPQKGEIYFNETLLNNIDYQSLQNGITYYSQDDVLFDCSIRENILSFNNGSEISEKELINVCKKINILDDILKLEKGFDSLLSESKALSLGQGKKIIIARALLKPSQLILFDEPLTGLDENSQKCIIETLKELRKDKILIIATHRPENFSFCEHHIVL